MLKKLCLVTVGMLALSACSLFESWEEEPGNSVVQEESLAGAMYKVEQPYAINGVWYWPAENYQYTQTGLASWYVPQTDNAITANGEQYIPSVVSARHKTLPLPSIVRITNLENGKNVIARVNDRGPMVNNRLIDVSQKGAELLELPVSGTAQVKVEVLPAESQAVKAELVNAGRVWTEQVQQKDLDSVPSMPVPETKVESDLAREVIYQPESTQQQITKSKRGIYVRLGAFGNASNVAKAERSANMVAKAVIDTTDRNGKTLKIVKAGPFSTKAEANDAVIKLRTMGYQDAYISK